jgi:tripartite-type tricarboxylate transporter receptor subunit TctC
MTTSRRQLLAIVSLCTAAFVTLAGSRTVLAQSGEAYPNKPITIIVPQAAGGANDTVARGYGQRLAAALGQPVVIENRPGAGGNVGTGLAARAARDGYTLLLTAQSAHTINPALYKSVPFDPVKDFEPIMVVATAPYLLAVNPSVPVRDFKELIALAKAQPGRLNYASAGNGTLNHLLGEMWKSAANVFVVHIPYRGAAAAATDVVGGQVQLTFGSFPGLMPFVRSGQLRVLGAVTEKRTALAPDMPTLAETLPGFHANSWYGLFAPAGTPPEVINRIHAASMKVLAEPELRERLAGQGAEVAPSSPAELARLLREELTRWAKIVKASGATID